MEIVDLIRISGKAAWLVLVLPLLTALGAGGYQTTRPTEYTGTVTLTVQGAVLDRTSAQYTRDLAALSKVDAVVQAAAKATGKTAQQVRQGTTTKALTDSGNIVQVSWTGPDPKADAVALAVTKATYQALTEWPVAQAKSALTATEKELAARKAALAKLTDPQIAVTEALDAVEQAKTKVADASSEKDKQAAREELATAQKAASDAKAAADGDKSYADAKTAVQEAENQVSRSKESITRAQDVAVALEGKNALLKEKVAVASRTRAMARAVAGGGVVGLLAAVLILVGLQSVSGGRKAKPAGSARPGKPGRSTPRDAGSKQGRPADGQAPTSPGRAAARTGSPVAAAAGGSSRRGAVARPGNGRAVPDDVDSLPWIFGDPQQQPQQPQQRPSRSGY